LFIVKSATSLFENPSSSLSDATPASLNGVRSSIVALNILRAKSRKGLTDKEKTLIYDKEMIAKPGTELSLRHTFRFPRGEEHNLVEPRNCVERPIGSVTIDNIGYKDGNNQLTNASEVNVWLRKRPADERINVVADVVEEDLPLARAVKPFRKFMIKESDDHDLLN